jgi:hypothetical protein
MLPSILWHFAKLFLFASILVGVVYGFALSVVAPSIQAIGNRSESDVAR